jgi:hypothetical protein
MMHVGWLLEQNIPSLLGQLHFSLEIYNGCIYIKFVLLLLKLSWMPKIAMQAFNPFSRNVPQCTLLIFFTCLTPDDFTCQWGSSAA